MVGVRHRSLFSVLAAVPPVRCHNEAPRFGPALHNHPTAKIPVSQFALPSVHGPSLGNYLCGKHSVRLPTAD
ncbi:hypothetical protein BC567DRAFT_221447 [Phyllosticta citribraziliensis]